MTQGRWWARLALVLSGAVWILAVALSWAEARADGGADGDSADSEFSFQWLDPDKKISVIQNRKFLKARHLILSVSGGPGSISPYRNSWALEPRAAFWFSELIGIEVFYHYIVNTDSTTLTQLQAATSVLPVLRDLQGQFGGLIKFAPWYAKINLFNQILAFDWHVSLGGGMIQSTLLSNNVTTPDSRIAIFAGTGHDFHLTRLLDFKLNFQWTFFNAPISGTSGASTWFSNMVFGAGLGVKL